MIADGKQSPEPAKRGSQMFRCYFPRQASLSFTGPAISAKPEAASCGKQDIAELRFRRDLQVDPEPQRQGWSGWTWLGRVDLRVAQAPTPTGESVADKISSKSES